MENSLIGKLKILFANGRMTYPFFVGGDGVSIHTWLSYFHQKGAQCCALGVIDYKSAPFLEEDSIFQKLNELNYSYEWNFEKTKVINTTGQEITLSGDQLTYRIPYNCIMVKKNKFIYKLKEIIEKFHPDVVFTQLELSPEVLSVVQELNTPIMFFVHDIGPENKWTFSKIDENKDLVDIVFNSNFTKKRFENFNEYVKKHNIICYPPLKQIDYLTSNSQKFITMINPVEVKGGKIIESIIKNLPNKKFLIVKGWFDPKENGIYLEEYSNVTLWEKQIDMKKVYQITKFLLIPSVIDEGFCRVAVEAGLSGIPVIASRKGGLIEAIENGGILIENYNNIDDWIKSIEKLDEQKNFYLNKSEFAYNHSRYFLVDNLAPALIQSINYIVKKHYKRD